MEVDGSIKMCLVVLVVLTSTIKIPQNKSLKQYMKVAVNAKKNGK